MTKILFDSRANGLPINCTIDPSLDQDADATVPSSFMRVDGYC